MEARETIPAVRATMLTPTGKTRYVGPVGAPAEVVRDLIVKHDTGDERQAFAARLGINVRVLYAIYALRGTRRGRPMQLVSADVLERILHGLGLDHTRDQWGCFA